MGHDGLVRNCSKVGGRDGLIEEVKIKGDDKVSNDCRVKWGKPDWHSD